MNSIPQTINNSAPLVTEICAPIPNSGRQELLEINNLRDRVAMQMGSEKCPPIDINEAGIQGLIAAEPTKVNLNAVLEPICAEIANRLALILKEETSPRESSNPQSPNTIYHSLFAKAYKDLNELDANLKYDAMTKEEESRAPSLSDLYNIAQAWAVKNMRNSGRLDQQLYGRVRNLFRYSFGGFELLESLPKDHLTQEDVQSFTTSLQRLILTFTSMHRKDFLTLEKELRAKPKHGLAQYDSCKLNPDSFIISRDAERRLLVDVNPQLVASLQLEYDSSERVGCPATKYIKDLYQKCVEIAWQRYFPGLLKNSKIN